MSYYAIDYIPVVSIATTPTKSALALDYLDARYIKCMRSVPLYTTHIITSKDAGRLDLVCNQYYDDRSDLIQALARYNKIINPLTEVYVGREFLIPSISSLEEALQNANNSQTTENTYITLR